MATATNGAGLLSAVLTPTDNWTARSAARQEGLQLQSYLNQQKEAEVLEEQKGAAALEEQLQAFAALPFLGSDKRKAAAHFREEEKAVLKRLNENYDGNFKRWYAAEGKQWENGAKQRLLNAPFYATATENRRNVALAQAAREKNELLVGTAGPNGYRPGEIELQDFLAGKSDTFTLKGSYKPDDDLKELRDTYAPGKMPWERVAVTEEDKLAKLIDKFGAEMGTDKYLRQHKDVPTYYKTDPLTKAFDFARDEGRFAMEQGRFKMDGQRLAMEGQRLNMARQDQADSRVLKGLQAKKLGFDILAKQQELSGVGSNGLPFDYDLLAHPSEVVPLKQKTGTPKTLPNSKLDIGKLPALAAYTLFGESDETLARQLGLQKGKSGYSRGNITEGFTDQNGVQAFNLKNAQFTVTSLDPKVYYNPRDVSNRGLNPNGVNGYARVTVQFASPDEASKAGLYDPNRLPFTSRTQPTGWYDSQTELGAGVYDPATMTATFFTPAGFVDGKKNKPFVKAQQKAVMGQKARNESSNDAPYVASPNF